MKAPRRGQIESVQAGICHLARQLDLGFRDRVRVPIAGMSLVPVLLGWPLLLGPIHVVFLELIIDPVSSIVFESEPEEAGIMARPPRDPKAPLFDNVLLARGMLQGVVVLAAALGVFLLGVQDDHGENVARGMAFVTLVLGNLGLVMTNWSLGSSAFKTMLRPNPALGLVVTTTSVALLAVLGVPWLRDLFACAPLGIGQIAEAAGAALASLVVNDALDLVLARFRSPGRVSRLEHVQSDCAE